MFTAEARASLRRWHKRRRKNMSLLSVIGAVIQFVYFLLKTKVESDTTKKAENEKTLQEFNDAIRKRDASAVNLALNRLR